MFSRFKKFFEPKKVEVKKDPVIEVKPVDLGIIDLNHIFTSDFTSLTEKEIKQKQVLFEYFTKSGKLFFASVNGYSYKVFNSEKGYQETRDLFNATTQHEFTIDNTLYTFGLSHNIFYRPSEYKIRYKSWLAEQIKKYPQYREKFADQRFSEHYFDRFEILSNNEPKGSGTFGVVLEIAATLAPKIDENDFDYKTSTERVAKIQNASSMTPEMLEDMKYETRLTQEIEYLRSKSTMRIKDKFITVMHSIPGKTLEDTLSDISANQLTFEQTIHLMILLAKNVNSIHAKDIIHHDLKPANFIVDLIQKTARAIDFGLSKRKVDIDGKSFVGGTRGFMSDEQENGKLTDEKSDIHALGKVFGIIMYGETKSEENEHIFNLINSMCNYTDKNSRPNMNKILKTLEKTALTLRLWKSNQTPSIATNNKGKGKAITNGSSSTFKMLAKTKPFQPQTNSVNFNDKLIQTKKIFVTAHTAGTNARKEYDKYLYAMRSENKSGNYNSKNSNSREVLKNIFVFEANDSKEMQIYIDTIGIKALNGAGSKQDLQDMIDNIYNTFEDNMNRLLSMSSIFESMESKNNIASLSREIPMHFQTMKMINKYQKDDFSLDSMMKLNQKHSNYFADCTAKYSTLPPDNKPDLNHVAYLLCQPVSKDSPSNSLIKRIKGTIVSYIRETITDDNLKNKQRAASEERIKDMYDILVLMQKYQHPKALPGALMNEIDERLKSFKQGVNPTSAFWNFFSSSSLKSKIQSAIKQEALNAPDVANDENFVAIQRAKLSPSR